MICDSPRLDSGLRILISAYTCNPYQGSEHAVGWGFIHELAQRHHLCVIAEEENCREPIEKYLQAFPRLRERIEFHFIPKKRRPLLRKVWPPSYYRYYRKWHESAFDLATKLHAEKPFDLAHQLTMVGYREPGYLWKLGIPFVWGPIGGMGAFPWRFMPSLGAYGLAYYTAYNFINFWQERFSKRPRMAAQVAGKALISATPSDQEGTLKFWGQPSHLLAEVGLPGAIRTKATARAKGEPLRIVWSGLHIPRKALPLGLHALAALPESMNWTLDILGQGPKTASWKKLALRLGVFSRCRFHGWIERDEALDVMHSAHVMLITSLRDLTSTVTAEALAEGLPVVCLDHCGFSAAVDERSGIKVQVTSPKKAITDLRDAMLSLDAEDLRWRLAQGALLRAQDFDWRRKVDCLEKIYLEALRTKVR